MLHGGCSQLRPVRRAVEGRFEGKVQLHIPGAEVAAIGAAKEAFAVERRKNRANTKEGSLTSETALHVDGLAHCIAMRLGADNHKVRV